MAEPRIGREPFWRSDAVKAIAAMLVVAAVSALGGLANVPAGADNDSMMRLVEVRDLIAGQGWFDLHQYRLGVEGALPMHWSRLVDAPIAAIVIAGGALTGSQATGEIVAQFLWPLGLYALALYLLLRMGRILWGEDVILPLTVIGAVTLHQTGVFAPGALDHHNIQLVLMLAMVFFLLSAGPRNQAGWLAGTAAVLMLAIGMETAPYVAAGGLFVVGWFLLKGDEARDAAVAFGIAFSIVSAGVFAVTVSPSQWGAAYCDAFSVAQFSIGALGGAGLAAIAASRMLSETRLRRAFSLAALGTLTGCLVLFYFPQCLSDPYADLAPMLRTFWLSAVSEAQPVWNVLTRTPEDAAGYYATTLIGIFVLALRIRREGMRREYALLALMMVVSLLVAFWQIRGARFAAPLACLPLAMWVADWRQRAATAPGTVSTLGMAGAWIVSFSMIWALTADAWRLLSRQDAGSEGTAEHACTDGTDYDLLSSLPTSTILTISNLGAPILLHTSHRALAGPYHRNIAGNLATLEILMGPASAGAMKMREVGASVLAVCPGNPETAFLTRQAPGGLLANLASGDIPDWLERIPESASQPIVLYRVSAPRP